MYKINKQQIYIVQHREIQPLFYNNFKWSIIYKNIESLCCTPETNKILQINYTSIKKKRIVGELKNEGGLSHSWSWGDRGPTQRG